MTDSLKTAAEEVAEIMANSLDAADDADDDAEEDEDEDSDAGFTMTSDDEDAVSLAIDTAYKLLRHNSITPKQIVALGKALFALQRMPLTTPGASCEFGVTYSAGDRDYSEWKAIDFRIYEELFEISVGGSVYSRDVGSDSYSEPGWYLEVGCRNDNSDCSLSSLEGQISEYLNMGAKISANEECDDSFEMFDEE